MICIAVAGPWYARNAVSAVKFAIFSSRYNEIAEGRPDRVRARSPRGRDGEGSGRMAADRHGSDRGAGRPGMRAREAEAMAANPGLTVHAALAHRPFHSDGLAGAGTAAAILLCPSYFDARFLLPIWPVLAVDLGTRLRSLAEPARSVPKVLVGLAWPRACWRPRHRGSRTGQSRLTGRPPA